MTKINLGVRLTPEEKERLTAAWKKEPGCVNRAQFVKKAINAYAGETIFEHPTNEA